MEATKNLLEILRTYKTMDIDLRNTKEGDEVPYSLNDLSCEELEPKINSLLNDAKFEIPDASVKLVNQLNAEVIAIKNDFISKTINGKTFLFQKGFVIFDYSVISKAGKTENIIEEYIPIDLSSVKYAGMIKAYNEFSVIKHKGLCSLEEILLFNISEASTLNKLKLNLSVPEIALLFRLLSDEQKIISSTKSEIHRFIANSFQTKKQSDLSVASIKNKFDTPESNALTNIDALLVNLRQQLKKIK